ncbi:MAG: type I 3-dehydroquinate dehydratase [Planctomycetota bacterium]
MSTRLIVTLSAATPAEAAPLLQQPPEGADYLELRLDLLTRPDGESVRALLALPRSIPVIATCRPGPALPDDAARLALLQTAGEAGADVLDVDDTLLDRLPASVPGERLASCHVARFAPRLKALAGRVAGHGTRWSKLAVPADTPRQLAELLAIQEAHAGTLAVVPTGRLSEAGRVMSAGRGAPLSYAALDPLRPGHPDQPALARLHGVHGIGHVGTHTRFFAVLGSPVAHSLSPAWHNAVFRGAGMDARLVPLDVERVRDVLEVADALRLDGFAVTHPLKRQALEAAESSLPGAKTTGSANTLLRTATGWQARNTDWKAASELLPKLLKAWRKAQPGQTPRVLLLGSGGAARAIAVALFDEDVELGIWSRRLSNARLLADALKDSMPVVAIPEPAHFPADIVVNATPLGSPGAQTTELQVQAACFRPGARAVDLAYGAAESCFRAAAHEAQAQLTSGEDFFCLQARRQSEVFTGAPVPEATLNEALRRCGIKT